MSFLPIEVTSVEDNIIDCCGLTGTLIRDFGPWKKGEEKTLWFNFDKGVCQELNDDGEMIVEYKMELK